MVNLGSAIAYHALNTPDRLAVVYGGQRLSYASLYDRYVRVAGLLAATSIKPGDRVAVLMKNSLAFIEIALACSHVGAVFVPINFRLSDGEVAYILENSQTSLLFVDLEFVTKVPTGASAIVLDAAAQENAALLTAGMERGPVAQPRCPDDLYRLMYTSGTTSHPKGVMHSYSNVAWKALDHITALGLSGDVRLLIVGPLYHVGAFDLPGLAVLDVGGAVVLLRDFDPTAVMRAIEREAISGIWLAPVMLSAILESPNCGYFDVASLEWCVAGGERSAEAKIRQFSSIFRNARFVDAYGLTESCGGDTFMPPSREMEKIGSVGRAVPHLEIAIRNDGGGIVENGVEGEICLRGPKITKGYWRNPEKTAESFYDDWFRTGDIGVLDADGFLWITDRAKDMIISGGENIASSEVERVMYLLPQIAEAAVIGMPDPRWGERPVVAAVLKPGQSLDLQTVTEFCRSHLAPFKVPRELHFYDALPRNPSGKVLKRILREDLASRGPDHRLS